MLIDTSYNITEVAYKCGFNNMSNFNRIFKRKELHAKRVSRNIQRFGVRTFI